MVCRPPRGGSSRRTGCLAAFKAKNGAKINVIFEKRGPSGPGSVGERLAMVSTLSSVLPRPHIHIPPFDLWMADRHTTNRGKTLYCTLGTCTAMKPPTYRLPLPPSSTFPVASRALCRVPLLLLLSSHVPLPRPASRTCSCFRHSHVASGVQPRQGSCYTHRYLYCTCRYIASLVVSDLFHAQNRISLTCHVPQPHIE